MAIKAAMPSHFSIVVFGFTQIAFDLEVLWHLTQHDYPLHTFWHTYLGATIIAAVLTVLGKPTSQWIKGAWNRIAAQCRDADLTVVVPTTWIASFSGAFIGAFSHILLDSLFHPDIEPLQPWSSDNRLCGMMVDPHRVEAICILLGVIGLVWFFRHEIRKRKANQQIQPIARQQRAQADSSRWRQENMKLIQLGNLVLTKIRTHLEKCARFYEITGVVLAILISFLSLRSTQDALKLQRKEFALRNRPFVTIRELHFAGSAQSPATGILYPRTVEFQMVNIAAIPANRLHGTTRAILNSNMVAQTTIIPFALASDVFSRSQLFLSEGIYALATNTANRFEIITDVYYSGMLGERLDEYHTSERSIYDPVLGKFAYDAAEYK